MADYWKSQPKKFCTYCKCWIADNKPSVDFHERGKNHKENVANKITEIKQKSMEKAKQEAKATKEFAAMEEAAMKAYQEDLKRLGVEPVPAGPSATQSKPQEVKTKKKTEKRRADKPPARTDEWVKGVSSEGYPYYYNAVTGESRWEEPEGNKEITEDLGKTRETSVWVEAVTEDGLTYYYNTETRESRWEKPEDFVPVKDNLPSDSSSLTDKVSEECTAAESSESESSIGESTEQEVGVDENETEFAAEAEDLKKKKKDEADVQTSSDKETKETEQTSSDRETKETEPEPKRETNDGAQEQSTPVMEEKQVRKARKPTAYGTWEEIKEEEDPYEKVDLELPTVEYDCPPITELDIPQESKVRFKEKTITSLGDAAAIGNPVFKKRKTENGKIRNIRQRISDN